MVTMMGKEEEVPSSLSLSLSRVIFFLFLLCLFPRFSILSAFSTLELQLNRVFYGLIDPSALPEYI